MKKYKYKLQQSHNGFFIYIKHGFRWKLAKGSLSGHFRPIEYAVEAIKNKHKNENKNFKLSIVSKSITIKEVE